MQSTQPVATYMQHVVYTKHATHCFSASSSSGCEPVGTQPPCQHSLPGPFSPSSSPPVTCRPSRG
jgi:hypothetical protein